MARPNSSRPGTRRRAATARHTRWDALPGWAWLLLGAALVAFIAVVMHLAQPRHNLQSALIPSGAIAKPSASQPANRSVPVPPAIPPQYSFYQTLPKRDVEPLPAPPQPSPSAAAPTAKPAATQAPGVAAAPANTAWVIQVGSYRTAEEAERVRARLALLGTVARTETASVNGETWYRVRIGPLDNERAQALRSRLQANGVNAIVMKQNG